MNRPTVQMAQIVSPWRLIPDDVTTKCHKYRCHSSFFSNLFSDLYFQRAFSLCIPYLSQLSPFFITSNTGGRVNDIEPNNKKEEKHGNIRIENKIEISYTRTHSSFPVYHTRIRIPWRCIAFLECRHAEEKKQSAETQQTTPKRQPMKKNFKHKIHKEWEIANVDTHLQQFIKSE